MRNLIFLNNYSTNALSWNEAQGSFSQFFEITFLRLLYFENGVTSKRLNMTPYALDMHKKSKYSHEYIYAIVWRFFFVMFRENSLVTTASTPYHKIKSFREVSRIKLIHFYGSYSATRLNVSIAASILWLNDTQSQSFLRFS